MFDDLEEEDPDVTPDSPDRAIVWAIHTRGSAGHLTPEEAWAILHERYPDDPRFLLLNAYAELNESRRPADGKAPTGIWTPTYFLKKVERVLANTTEALHPQLRELVVFGGAVLAGAKGDDLNALALLRVRIGYEGDNEPKRDERDRAGLRLRRFEREVVKELHDRTEEGQPLGTRAAPAAPPSPADTWATAVGDGSKPRRKYSADSRFERGELIEHPKFGVGVVSGTEPGKVVILFESGVRKLVAST